ncbi:hypothetical protein J2Y00_004597 [Deinococcus soli (ex Cha et al. 2016)]|uniref:Uncharacterized protein n=1 Tax=Deinococcus soli (ex Cha et al. 2016) TaxID=1309411 RepID=A0AAE3XH75_9DEIO|nr:hypothetical protein [Deinococcus soli (ex Cha et al. 2016)]
MKVRHSRPDIGHRVPVLAKRELVHPWVGWLRQVEQPAQEWIRVQGVASRTDEQLVDAVCDDLQGGLRQVQGSPQGVRGNPECGVHKMVEECRFDIGHAAAWHAHPCRAC